MFAGCILTAAVCATLEKTNTVKSQDNISVGLFFFLLGASKLVSCAAKLQPCCCEQGQAWVCSPDEERDGRGPELRQSWASSSCSCWEKGKAGRTVTSTKLQLLPLQRGEPPCSHLERGVLTLLEHRPQGLDLPQRVQSPTRLMLSGPTTHLPRSCILPPGLQRGQTGPSPTCCHHHLKPLNVTAGFQSEILASNQVNNCTSHLFTASNNSLLALSVWT